MGSTLEVLMFGLNMDDHRPSSPRKKPLHQGNPEMFQNWALKV